MAEFFKQFQALINRTDDEEIKGRLYEVYKGLQVCSRKMSSATKFIDFFVHDILDYTILNKDEKNFTKNMAIFSIQNSVNEIIDTMNDKA